MSKTAEAKKVKDVESAIRSLYDKFKDPSTGRYGGCSDIKTKETIAIKKKIAKRQSEINNDKVLKQLEKDLKAEQCKVIAAAKSQHERVDELLRKFQVRGLSPDLLDEVEVMSGEKPAYVEMCGCDDEDDG